MMFIFFLCIIYRYVFVCVKQRFINKDILRPTAQPIIIPEKSEQDDILCKAIILIKLQMIYIAFILISTQTQ